MGQNTAPSVRVTLDISLEYPDGLVDAARRKTPDMDGNNIVGVDAALTTLIMTSDLLFILADYGVIEQVNVEQLLDAEGLNAASREAIASSQRLLARLNEPKSTAIKVAGLVREALVSDMPITSVEELAAANGERFLTPAREHLQREQAMLLLDAEIKRRIG